MPAAELRDWSTLSPDEQLSLREAYGRDPDCQSGTCSLDAKMARFTDWLAARGVRFGPEHMSGRQ